MKRTFYKYRPLYRIGPTGKEEPHPFTQSIFEKAEIWYSAPKDFNDPYDCNLKLHVDDSTDSEWEVYLDNLMYQYPDAKPNLMKVKAKKVWRLDRTFVESIGKLQHEENYQQSSVYCLSKKANSIPMFSYYSDSHRGIAIEFQFADYEVPCGIPCGDIRRPDFWYERKIVFRDVEYPPGFPELNYHRLYGSDQLLKSIIFTKHHEWAHEEEFRIFRRRIPAASVQFERKLLTRVVFGCKTTQAEVDLVKGWIVDWPTDVMLSKAETAKDRFELVINDFELIKGTGKA